MHKVTMLGTGLIAMFYTESIRVGDFLTVCKLFFPARRKAQKMFAEKHGIPKWTTDMKEAIDDPDTDLVIVGCPITSIVMPLCWPQKLVKQ